MVLLAVAAVCIVVPVWLTLPQNNQPVYPLVVSTWAMVQCNRAAWNTLQNGNSTALDALEAGGNACENDPEFSGYSVGYGGSPNEIGETTLDAMVMWAPTHSVGAVGCLRRVKNAISVARQVMEQTLHTLLVGDDATNFALQLGFAQINLSTPQSIQQWQWWLGNGSVPNFWRDGAVPGNPTAPPGTPTKPNNAHDTIGMIVIDAQGNIACGTTTNGLTFKIPGRVGDSPIPGSGAYCDNDVGGAVETGNGDIMMRFAPSKGVVELMRMGVDPQTACNTAIAQIGKFYPQFSGAIVAVSKAGKIGAAYMNVDPYFPLAVRLPNANDTNVWQYTQPYVPPPAPPTSAPAASRR
jgi:N4-(beta-N-acetylglucosaminyl)-L-asparaginase